MKKQQSAIKEAKDFAKEKHDNLLQLKVDIELEPNKHKLPLVVIRDLMDCYEKLAKGETYITLASETARYFARYSFIVVKARYLDFSIKYREAE